VGSGWWHYCLMRSLRRAPRVAAWALLALAVLLMHGLLLQALRPPPAVLAPVASHGPLVALRLIVPPPPAPEPAPAVMAAAPEPRLKPAPLRPRVVPVQPLPLVAPPEPAVEATALPVYATRLPDAARLHYRLQRGDIVGNARLQWQPEAGDYLLRLDTDWPGQPAAGSASRGQIDAEGLAPVRHAELRRAREVRAANFQREVGRITFSGPQLAYALPPGAQDRLSWMIQLPGVLQADAALARAGAQVTLFVVGTRGDAEPWRFEVLGREALQLPAGEVPQALRLKREPTRPYDTRVEVWLDPARQHLPVRVVFTTLPGGQPLEMALEIDAAAPR
jgi:hypothetical protein